MMEGDSERIGNIMNKIKEEMNECQDGFSAGGDVATAQRRCGGDAVATQRRTVAEPIGTVTEPTGTVVELDETVVELEEIL